MSTQPQPPYPTASSQPVNQDAYLKQIDESYEPTAPFVDKLLTKPIEQNDETYDPDFDYSESHDEKNELKGHVRAVDHSEHILEVRKGVVQKVASLVGGSDKSPMMLMMIMCCGLPLLFFVILPLVGLHLWSSSNNASWIFVALILVVLFTVVMSTPHRKQL